MTIHTIRRNRSSWEHNGNHTDHEEGHDNMHCILNKCHHIANLHLSSSEFDTFSTASLITRSTNDIQQIQILTVMMLRMVLYAPIVGLGGVYKVFRTNVDMSWILAVAVAIIFMVIVILFTIVMPKFKVLHSSSAPGYRKDTWSNTTTPFPSFGNLFGVFGSLITVSP